MRKALERALDHAEHVTESVQRRPPKRKYSGTGGKSLHEKLYDLYVEECGKEPEVTEDLTRNVNLLEKLVTKESLPCLVVDLYPGEEGYSLMLRVENELYSDIILLPYEERDFLKYLVAEELSPELVGVLEKSQVNIFQSGCVIAEVRDYRQGSNTAPLGYHRRHVLLRPAMQTLAYNKQSISSDNQVRNQEDRILPESQLTSATAEPLCLDPSVSVACTANRLLHNKQKVNTPPVRRNLQSYPTASLSRPQELSCSPPPLKLRVRAPDKKSTESQAGQQYDLNISKAGTCVDTWKQRPWDLEVPSELDVGTYAKEDWPVNYGDTQPTVWPAPEAQDASLFGWEAGNPSQTTKPASMQSLDPFVSGIRGACQSGRCEIQMFHGHSSTDDHSKSSMPGSKTNAGKAASQSKKLVQKSPKCPVREPQGSRASASLSQLSPGRATAQPQAVPSPASVLGKGVQPTPPPSGLPYSPGNSFSGHGFIPLHASSFPEAPSSAAASRPPGLPKNVKVNRLSTFPAATRSKAGASPRTLARQVKAKSALPQVIHLVGPVRLVRAVVSGSNPMQGSSQGATAPSGGQPGNAGPRNAGPAAPQAPCQIIVQYTLGNLPNLKPLGLIWIPQDLLFPDVQQQGQQSQPLFYQLIPLPQLQQPPTSGLPQPVAQGSHSQQTPVSGQQVFVITLSGVGTVLQPQGAVLPAPGSGQTRRGRSRLQPRVQRPSVPQPQPQQVQFAILQPAGAVVPAAAHTARPGRGQQAAGQAKGTKPGGPPGTPRP